MSSESVGVFIDGGYTDHMNSHGYLGKLNFRKFIPYICENEGILKYGYYYTCMPYQEQNPTDIQKQLYAQKQKLNASISKIQNMIVKYGKLKKRGNNYIQKRVDVLLALDLAKHSWKRDIDTAIIIAGDSDFVPAIQEARNSGVKVILYYYEPAYNRELIRTSSESIEITKEMFTQFAK